MKSIFEEESYQELINRLEKLNENSERQWGKMSVGQMAWHCQFPLKYAIENRPPKKKPNPLIGFFFKKSLYNDKPWRKNLPTAPLLKAKEEKDFTAEKAKLMEMVQECHKVKNRTSWNAHPMFGKLTHEQWGKMQYKHLDHHLKQFGV